MACETLTNTELPERYMNIKSLSYIIEVLKVKDAQTLREAVELLELEIKIFVLSRACWRSRVSVEPKKR
ncbi:hypothetical protein AAFF39_07390 [Lactococcus garvieae]